MNIDEKYRKQFEVARCWAIEEMNKSISYVDAERYSVLIHQLNRKGLSDSQCLFRMILKEVEAYNTNIRKRITLLRNLTFSNKWLSSKLFSGLNIPMKKIDELIAAHPDKANYQIVRIINGWEA